MPPRDPNRPVLETKMGFIISALTPVKNNMLMRLRVTPTLHRFPRFERDLNEDFVWTITLGLIRLLFHGTLPTCKVKYSERVRALAREHFLALIDDVHAGGGWEE